MNEERPIAAPTTLSFTGFPTFLRLPHQPDPHQLDVAIVGVPFDTGTLYKNGTRFGPREIRVQSSLIRGYNPVLQINPTEKYRVADFGDINASPFSLEKAFQSIELGITTIINAGARPLVVGGDHSISLPILRALAQKHGYGKLGLIHLDSHLDTSDEYFGEKYYHGAPFRRAVEENLLNPQKITQLGIRGSVRDNKTFEFSKENGITVIPVDKIFEQGIPSINDKIREFAKDGLFYLSFDIDVIDPSYAPGTGTPQIGGITSYQALQLIRNLHGIEFVGCDLVEVSPPYDSAGITSLLAANLIYEILCIM